MKYDDRNLRKFFADLDRKGRKKVIQGACRKVGNSVKKVAVKNLRASGLNNADKMTAGVRVVVFRREAGVRVTVASRRAKRDTGKGERGMHTNRYGKKKPVLAWAETGTRRRKSKNATRYQVGGKWRSGRSRGSMKRYGFIARTLNQVEHSAGDQLKEEITDRLNKLSKKDGCS